MAKSVAEFHARANLDSSAFDQGAANMSKSMYDAARSVDDAWGLINTSAVKSAKSTAALFGRAGMGPIDITDAERNIIEQQEASAQRRVELNDRIAQSMQRLRAETIKDFTATAQATSAKGTMLAEMLKTEESIAARSLQMQKGMVSARIQAIQNATAQEISLERSVAIMREENARRAAQEESRAAAQAAKNRAVRHALQDYATFGPNYVRQIDSANKSVSNYSQTLGMGSKVSSRYGVIMQQVGYQVQDFAIQVAAGQNKLVAFAQQGSQLVSFFGPYGAIAGAILNAGVMVYRIFDTSLDGTEKAEKAAAKLEREYEKIQARVEKVRDAWLEIDKLHGSAYRTVNPRSEKDTMAYRAGLSGEAMPKLLNAARDAEGLMMIAKARGNTEEAVRQENAMLAAQKQYAEVRQEVADIDASIAKRHLSESERYDKESREEEEANTKRYQAIGKQADAIREQLRPMEKMKREAKEIADNLFLSDEDKRAAIDAMIKPTALPQALQVNAGASALGGTVGDGGALLQIQQKMAADMHALLEAARAQLRLFAGV